jgi:hypothetical protein
MLRLTLVCSYKLLYYLIIKLNYLKYIRFLKLTFSLYIKLDRKLYNINLSYKLYNIIFSYKSCDFNI